MATSDIDQKILCQIAKSARSRNPLLSSALYQTLGLSIILSYKLYRAGSMRRLDTTRDTPSLALYHQIIWLSREGLAITEVLILPYCQTASQDARCRVMAAKLRATFYHIFCLYHNHPPISQLTPPKTSPSGKTIPNGVGGVEPTADVETRQAVLRETIPSMVSETSYVTNPFTNYGPAQTPPPTYPPPPVPTMQKPLPATPVQSARLSTASPAQRSPPSSADFIMPPINFVPAATAYFSQASVLAKRLLPGADPLRLSIALETCAFTWECGKDFALAKQKAKMTLHDAYSAPENIDDAQFEDAATLVGAIISIAKRNDSAQASSRSETPVQKLSPRSSASNSPTRKLVPKTPPLRSPRQRRPRSRQSQKSMQPSSRKLGKMPATTITETESSTPEVSMERLDERETYSDRPSVTSPGPPPEDKLPSLPGHSPASRKSPRRPRANSKASQQSKGSSAAGTTMSEKERKRHIVEQAEERLRRRRESQSQSSTSEKPEKQ